MAKGTVAGRGGDIERRTRTCQVVSGRAASAANSGPVDGTRGRHFNVARSGDRTAHATYSDAVAAGTTPPIPVAY